MKNLCVGFAMCGSFCTFDAAIEALETVCAEYKSVLPIMSDTAYGTDSRFGPANEFIRRVEKICNHPIIHTIPDAEPIGPNRLLDVLVIAPCTGNTLAKIAHGVTDTAVTMAAKAHLRNNRPLLLAISTNDGLSANAQNLGVLLARKNIYFVPFCQDDPEKKPTSLVAELDLLPDAIDSALRDEQLQPILCC